MKHKVTPDKYGGRDNTQSTSPTFLMIFNRPINHKFEQDSLCNGLKNGKLS